MPFEHLAQRTVPALINHGSQAWGERTALLDHDRHLTYRDLHVQVRRYALSASEIAPQGGRILMMMGNHLDHVLTWLGASYAGRVQAQVNTGLRGDLLAHVLRTAEADSIIVDPEHVPTLLEILEQVPAIQRILVNGSVPTTPAPGGVAIERWEPASLDLTRTAAFDDVLESDPLSIMFTSGTTGRSKGVLQPHGLPFSYVDPDMWGLVEFDDTVLVALPQFHIAGQWTGILAPLMVGGAAALVERFSASEFWSDVDHFGATQTTLIAAMVSFLLSHPASSQDQHHALRSVLMAPVTPAGEEFARRFNVRLASGLGQTESSAPVVARYGHTSPGACGWARPDFEIRVVDQDDREVASGDAGEMISRPRRPWTTMLEYIGSPAATAEKWRNLWIHSGDLVRQDDSGQVFFVDRTNDSLRRRGENISSAELESVIADIADIALVAVVGEPAAEGEHDIRVCLILEKGSDTTPEDLHAEMVRRLPKYMVPRYIDIRSELPRTPTERVKKADLRAEGLTETTWDAQAHGLEH